MSDSPAPDYSLSGANSALAIERGLAEADWYTTSVPKHKMRSLLQRRDGPAIRDTLLLIAVLAVTAWATIHFWGTWWVVLPYLIYAVFYATSSDSRWHECGHGTAFKTDWMNTLLYEVASFMVMRESVVWRWSHNRHHSDTIIVGRDPEIQIPRPPDLRALFLSLFNVGGYLNYFPNLIRHTFGTMSADEKTFIPESEFSKVYRNARICLAVHLTVIGSAFALQTTLRFTVKEVRNVATFIREITLEPESKFAFQPGDYLQFEIPIYQELKFSDFAIPEPYAGVWSAQHVFDLVARNPDREKRNNYSLASDPDSESLLRLNVRIATPPPGQDCPPGLGSAYMFSLRPGDTLAAVGPFGDFHIRPTQREMVYIGGGSGMAPLRSHITHLFETGATSRKVSFWFGARSRQEWFYQDHFESLAARFPNFTFHPALSSPLDSDAWTGPVGFIHGVAFEIYLKNHAHPRAIEFYLCGPPQMMKACQKMLRELGVEDAQITFDEF